MNKELEEQIKFLKTIIRLNEDQSMNQKNLIEQLKQVRKTNKQNKKLLLFLSLAIRI